MRSSSAGRRARVQEARHQADGLNSRDSNTLRGRSAGRVQESGLIRDFFTRARDRESYQIKPCSYTPTLPPALAVAARAAALGLASTRMGGL